MQEYNDMLSAVWRSKTCRAEQSFIKPSNFQTGKEPPTTPLPQRSPNRYRTDYSNQHTYIKTKANIG